jgi:hypothetical protein
VQGQGVVSLCAVSSSDIHQQGKQHQKSRNQEERKGRLQHHHSTAIASNLHLGPESAFNFNFPSFFLSSSQYSLPRYLIPLYLMSQGIPLIQEGIYSPLSRTKPLRSLSISLNTSPTHPRTTSSSSPSAPGNSFSSSTLSDSVSGLYSARDIWGRSPDVF